jgi:hypothetical protein
MRLTLERGDAHGTRRTSSEYGVFDEITGNCVGTLSIDRVLRANKLYPTRTIRLFDGKYIGSFDTHTECVAFVKGVEVVLNHMLKAKDVKSVNAVLLNHMLEVRDTG